MDTVVSGAGQPIVVGGDKGHHNHDGLLVSVGQMHDAVRHNDGAVREHCLHGDASRERFALRELDELAQVKRELSELKADLSLKIVEESHRTRELMREETIFRMRADESTLRNQLIAAGIVPAA